MNWPALKLPSLSALAFLRAALVALIPLSVASAQTTVSPTSLSWAKVALGQTGAAKSVTLTNNGSAAITITSVSVTGTSATDFIVSANTCGTTLAAAASCTTSIKFKPTAVGTRTATLSYQDSDPSSPQQVSLSGLGTGTVTATPSSLVFGNVKEGSTSAAQTISISNTTSSAVSLTTPSISGSNATDFAQSSTTCGSSLAASATCTASVTFTPSIIGSESASWSITSSNSTTALTVALSGTGSAGAASVSPTSISWATVAIGQTSAAKTTTLTNSGTTTISVSSIQLTGTDPGDFAISKNACSSTLAAATSCTISVVFRPIASGTRTANLTFTDSDPSSPQQVSLTGLGAGGSNGSVSVTPTSLSFGSITIGSSSTAHSISVSNNTSSSVTLSSGAISGTNAADFSASSNCGSSLAASSSCTASVTFTPSISGTETASWSITSSASSNPLTVSLAGTGQSSGGSSGTAFYVSNCGVVGNDSNSGTSPSSPWLTIAKVNSSTFAPGDSIEFNSGCVWREQLSLPSPGTSGSPITVMSYGSGSPPVINGSQVATAWVAEAQSATNFTTDPNLQGYWTMDQMSGSSFLDSSQNGNTLTNVNGVTQSTNHVQGTYSAAFTAADSVRLMRLNGSLSAGFVGQSGTTNTNVTAGGWVYFNSLAGDMSFMMKGGGKSWGLFLGTGSNIDKMQWQAYLNSGYKIVASNQEMATGSWYHVVGRINAATGEQALFINGVKQNTTITNTNTTFFTDTTSLQIGASSAGYFLDGNVDELFVFNRALSDAEIASIYGSGFDGSRGDYTLYYVTGFQQPSVVYENGIAMSTATQKAGMTQGSWWWDSTDQRVYIRPSEDVNPSTETIEIPQRTACIIDYRNYTIINGLTCQEPIQQGVYVTGTNVTIENMMIQHVRANATNSPNLSSYGVGIFWMGSNDVIQNNTVTDANWGIFSNVATGSTVDSGLVESNTVSNIAYDGIGLAVANINGGVLANTIAQYNVVSNVGIYGQLGGALECIYGGTTVGPGNTIRYNLVFNNGTPSLHSYPLNVQGGAGSCNFYGNIVYNNYGPCLEVAGGPGGNTFYNNVCYNNGLAGKEGAGFFLNGGTADTGNIIENNIVYAGANAGFLDVSPSTGAGNTIDYNVYYGGTSTPFVWNGTAYSMPNYLATSGQDAHSINANPQFNNPSANDFTLAPSSPAIAAGINLGPNFQFDLHPGSTWPNNVTTASQSASGGWDIGAYINKP